MALRVVPEVLDSFDMVPYFNEPIRVIDAMTTKPEYIQRVRT